MSKRFEAVEERERERERETLWQEKNELESSQVPEIQVITAVKNKDVSEAIGQ